MVPVLCASGLKNPNRPIASFIFSGPTGVGKSELAKTLATYYFGSQEAMVRLDMSEFMERHTVSKLIGSPPGDPLAELCRLIVSFSVHAVSLLCV